MANILNHIKSCNQLSNQRYQKNRKATQAISEVLAILIAFQGGQFRNFKHFYIQVCCLHLKDCLLMWFPIIGLLN